MNKPPMLSVGLPIYNGENYVREALDALLCQTFTDFELIISDNASTDQTPAICQEYVARDSRVKYFSNKENLGAAVNYNRTFELSSGKYFKWMAHDDLFAPTFLERCITILENNPDVVVCYSQTMFIDKDGKEMVHYSDQLHLTSPKPHRRFQEFNNRPGWYNPIFGVIRSKNLKVTPLIGKFQNADKALLAELTLHGQFYEIPEDLFFHRVHPDSYTMRLHARLDKSVEWYDPGSIKKMVLPRWQLFSAYPKAIFRAPISLIEKFICLLYLSNFVLQPKKWKGIFIDFIIAVKTGLNLVLRKRKGSSQ